MDNTAQQTMNTQGTVPASQPQVPAVSQPAVQAPVFHPQAVGGPKESVPFSSRTIEAPVSEYVQPSEVVPEIPQEVVEAGVEQAPNKERPQLDETHQAAGITHSDPVSIPHIATPTGTVALPYTFEEATQIEKATTEDDSEHWLVLLSKFIMRKLALKQ